MFNNEQVTCFFNFFDGKHSYSQIRSIQRNLTGLSIYPNPAINEKITLKFNSDVEEDVEISITNNLGQSIYSEVFKTTKGANEHLVWVHQFANGFYILQVKSEKLGVVNQKVEF